MENFNCISLTIGFFDVGDQPLTETVQSEIKTLGLMKTWFKFGLSLKAH
jgi:hypothetical protein